MADRPISISGVASRAGSTLANLRAALCRGVRLDSDDIALPALAEALTGEFGDSPCVVLSS